MKTLLKLLGLFVGFWAIWYAIAIALIIKSGNTDVITFDRFSAPWIGYAETVAAPIVWTLKAWWNVWFGDGGNLFSRWYDCVEAILTHFPALCVIGFILLMGVVTGKFDTTIGLGLFVAVVLFGPITAPLTVLVFLLMRVYKPKKKQKKDEKKPEAKKPEAKPIKAAAKTAKAH